MQNLTVMLAQLRRTLVIRHEITHRKRHADRLEIAARILLVNGHNRAIPIQIRIVLQLIPIQHRADRHALRTQFLGQRVLVELHGVRLNTLVHLGFMLVTRIGGIETRVGQPILESHRMAEILEALLGLLNHYIYVSVRVMLPAFRAVAPAKHQTTLRIRCARNGFALLAPLIIRVAVIVGKLAQTVENQLVSQLDTAQVQHRILHRLVHIATLTGDINDAFAKAFGSDAWSNDALNALFTIRQTLVGFIDTAKGKLKDARQTVSDFMGGFMDTAPIDVFVAMLSNIWDAAASGIDALGSFGRTVMSIIDMLNPLSGTAIQASDAGAMLGGAFQTAGSLIAAASGIIQTVAGALTQVSGWIDEHGDAVSATLLAIGTGLAVFKVAGIIQAVAGAMQGFSVATAAASAATQIATAAQAAFNLVMEMNPLVLVISLLAALTAGLVYFFTQTKTGQQAWSSFTNFISGCLTSIGNLFRNLGNSIGSIFTSATDGATKTWNNVANWFSNLPGRIGGFFSNAGSLLVNAGASIINGFWDGLKSMWSNVTGWISGIGDWIKAHKGPISYDRRLLIPAGQAIMTGFAQGLNNGFDNSVETAISRANRRLAAMPLNLSAQGNTAAPAVVNTWNVEINGEVIDKDGTAKAIKRLLADYDARRS
jgi:phage-related protein